MPGNGLFHKLILRWFLLRQQGRTLTSADLCRDCPEHQQEVERFLQGILALGDRTAGNTGRDRNAATATLLPILEVAAFPPAADPSPVSGLLLRWQEQREQGIDLSTDELCQDCPEHREEVSGRLRALRDFYALLGAVDLPGGAPAVAQAPLVPGYEILETLGEGGMGIVYKARQVGLDRIVALKMIRDGGYANADTLARFGTEAEAIARLQHPNIVQVFEVGAHDGRPFLAMEFCPGGGLDRKLAGTPLPPREAAALMETLARAMEAAHRARVVHRDLKPANILLLADGTPKISDFGLARKLDEASQTQTGSVVGTPSYMAPEQAAGASQQIGPRTDVYALGATFYELLTGRPPFKAACVLETLEQVRFAEPVPPARLQMKVPRDLETICLKCLHKEPAGRFASALELAADLRRFQVGEPIQARPAGLLEKLLKWGRRHPATVALLAAFACAVVALAVAGFFAWRADVAEGKRQAEARHNEETLRAEKRQNAIDKALTAATAGDLAVGEQAIAEAERMDASTGQLRMLRGQLAFHHGKTQEAIQHLKQAAVLQPNSVAVRGMLAAAYAYNGEWDLFNARIDEIQRLTPVTAEDFLFKGYAEANMNQEGGLKSINEAIRLRPSMIYAKLLRAEVRVWLAGDRGDLAAAERAVQDAENIKEWLPDHPAVLWVSLSAQLTAAGVYERLGPQHQLKRAAALAQAQADAEALKRFPALPDAVVFRWLYFREVGQEDKILDELRRASEQSDHVYLATCYALTLYKRGEAGKALNVVKKCPSANSDRLIPILLAEIGEPTLAREAYKEVAQKFQNIHDGGILLEVLTLLRFLGDNPAAQEASKDLRKHPKWFSVLRPKPLLQCLEYNAGFLSAIELDNAVKGSLWDECCAHYYIGMTKLGEGDRAAARERFRKAFETRAYLWNVHDLSWVFLARLDADPTWPPWILPKK